MKMHYRSYSIVFALFAISLTIGHVVSECIQGPYGAGGGDHFSDRAYGRLGKIKAVRIRSGNRVDSVQFTYGNFQAPQRGRNGGTLSYFTLESDEYIVKIEGRRNKRLDQLRFFTSKGRQFGPYGGRGGTEFVAMGNRLQYISGRAGREIDQLMFHFNDC